MLGIPSCDVRIRIIDYEENRTQTLFFSSSVGKELYEIYDRGGAERGQRNTQGRMEEDANQLYRQPQMTGKAWDEELERYNYKPIR